MYVCSCIIAIVLYVVLCDWQERKAVANCQINNQSINQSINHSMGSSEIWDKYHECCIGNGENLMRRS